MGSREKQLHEKSGLDLEKDIVDFTVVSKNLMSVKTIATKLEKKTKRVAKQHFRRVDLNDSCKFYFVVKHNLNFIFCCLL